MKQSRVPYQKILFVCVRQREPHEACCAQRGAEAIADAMKTRIQALGFSRQIRVSKSGCQDRCAKGPNVMVFPDYVWYRDVQPEDVERIIQGTIQGLKPTVCTEA
ncbi:MAG: (2Fe-2S) ferredoxin domain-containing protein [Candidatus Omnitrophica bacterium]|nr:(2Fe-2S) ferredoxin domain-containing protein [Candidatus Omnitrophota bacterium]